MDPTGGNFPAVLDRRTAAGQGLATGNIGSAGAAHDHLILFNGFGDTYFSSSDVPPLAMFVNGNNGGLYSYDAEPIVNVNGVLFFPQDAYGNEFSFTSSFSVEFFFKSDGDQSESGPMQLLKQGEGNFRYGIDLNSTANGAITFALVGAGLTNRVALTNRNYADGTWHYVSAVFDQSVGTFGQMRLTVANQNGSDTNAVKSLAAAFSNATANDGNLFLGRNTYDQSDPQTFLGLIDEVQISSGVIANSNRLGRIPSIDGAAPPAFPPSLNQQPASQSTVVGGLASFNVVAVGDAPLRYQWRKNNSPIIGATNTTFSIFPVFGTNAANYDVVVTNASGSVTSSVALLTVLNPYPIVEWPMDSSGGVVVDARTNVGQGTVDGTAAVGASVDPLVEFNQSGDAYYTSNSYPPIGMFVNTNGGAPVSYNASPVANIDGALVYTADRYGDEFSFRGSFSIELFFKTDGNQSASGIMQLLMQGEDSYRYGITLNESGAGSLRFGVDNGSGEQTISLTSLNYADGAWHYMLAAYDAIPNQLRLTVVNPSGTENSATNSLPPGFGPLFAPAAGRHNMLIGRNTYSTAIDPRPFLGLIDEVQITAGVVPSNLRVGRVPSVDGPIPSGVAPFATLQPVPQTAIEGSIASFSIKAQGSDPISYQWRRNGTAVPGGTNQTLQIFPAAATSAGNYDVVMANTFGSSTSAVAVLTVLNPVPIAWWKMVPSGSNDPVAVADSRIAPGQGFFTGPNLPQFAAEADNLIIKGDPGIVYSTSTNVPPLAMFMPGIVPGGYSYNAQAITNLTGALFFPQDGYGNEFSFRGAFSVELFFKTDGNRSTAGTMQLLKQGEGNFRYGFTLNETNAGAARFTVSNGTTNQTADLAGRNYADGQWHYMLAQYDPMAAALHLTIANEDGTDATTNSALPAGFGPLPAGNDGNLFIGRNTFDLSSPRTFLGLIDEVQITAGLVQRGFRLGKAPSLDLAITAISVVGANVQIDFKASSSDTPASFVLQRATTVNGTYADVASTITSLGGGNFRAASAVSGSSAFYRVRRQ